jgi:preprotein translocase subunit SecG
MYLLLLIVAIIVCVLLGIIVLVQNPKGGGLASNFSSSSQLMGVQRTGDFLEKGTWILVALLMGITLMMNVIAKSGSNANDNAERVKQTQDASKPSNTGAQPAASPFNAAPQPKPTTPAGK